MAKISVGGSSRSPKNIRAKGSPTFSGVQVGTTEVSYSLPSGITAFRIQTASGSTAVLYLAIASGDTADPLTRMDLKMGNGWEVDDLGNGVSRTLYIRSSKANTDIQIVTWD